MTRIQQVLFELEGDYYGHPYYVTGNALYHALAQRVSEATRRVLCVSHGIFVPSERGPFPAAHSSAPANKRLGTRLPPVERYSDLFLYRDSAHRWIGDTQPRDTTNTHELRSHGGRVTYGPETRVGQPPDSGIDKWTHTMHVHCYLHTSAPAAEVEFPLSKETLDGLQVGGGRNYGLGRLSVADTRTVDLDSLSTPVLDAADDYVIELL